MINVAVVPTNNLQIIQDIGNILQCKCTTIVVSYKNYNKVKENLGEKYPRFTKFLEKLMKTHEYIIIEYDK